MDRMLVFARRRLLHTVPVLIGTTIITFFMIRLIPGGPAVALLGSHYSRAGARAAEKRLGLDEPIWQQYLLYLGRCLRGDFGVSFYYKSPVLELIRERLPVTVTLIALAAILTAALSIPVATVAAWLRGGLFDNASRVAFTVSFAMPSFWLGIILLILFSVQLPWFPLGGAGTGLADTVYHLFLPALTISLAMSTAVVRTLRSSTIAVLESDFVNVARTRGLSRARLVKSHILPNSLRPIIAVFSVNLAFLIGTTVIVESVFGLPGLGDLLVSSVDTRDYPVIQALTLLFAIMVIIVNFGADIVQAAMDPRIQL